MKKRSPRWLKVLPAGLRARIEGRANLLRIISNAAWLLFDKVIRVFIGLFVGVWVARYLGPEQFGTFNYAIALVAMFSAIASLGLNGIVVRELIAGPEEAPVTLGTAFVLQIIGGVVALALPVIVVGLTNPGDMGMKAMVAIIGFAGIFKASDVIKYWFESKVQARSIVLIEGGAFITLSAFKILLILGEAPLMAFVVLILLEGLLVAAGLFFIYRKIGNRLANWQWRSERAKKLLVDSWPLVLSGLAAMVYMRIDQIMIGQILGDVEVGVFSAAVRITEICYLVPMMIASSVYPAIIEAKKRGDEFYYNRLRRLFELMACLSVVIALPTSLLAPWIIRFLYGASYDAASAVLSIQIWASVFVFSGVASSRWFLVENLQKYSFYRTLAGAVINVLLNYILIPVHGVEGAAWATLISQAVASVLFNVLNVKTRPIFFMQVKAITGISFFQK